MPYLRSLPDNASLADLRKAYGELFEKLRPYAQELMRGPSPLSPGQRELIAAYVSGLNSCHYCYGSHKRVAEGFGIEPDLLETLLEDIDNASIDTALKPLLYYARKLTVDPAGMKRADADRVYEAGWNDEALLHTVAVCAYFNNMNRLVEGTGLEGSEQIYEFASFRLLDKGYT